MEPGFTEYRCLQCDEVTATPLPRDLIACVECSLQYTRRRGLTGAGNGCPVCGQFGRTIGTMACPRCRSGELVGVRRFTCMLCGSEHYRDREPSACGGDGSGDREGVIIRDQASPSGRPDETLALPSHVAIEDVIHWVEIELANDRIWRYKQWRLSPAHANGKARMRVTAAWDPDGELTITHECQWCPEPTKASMEQALTEIARGVHRHGLAGIKTAGPEDRAWATTPVWPGDEYAIRTETIPWKKPPFPENAEPQRRRGK